MALETLNPWHVESLDAFNFLCCPECVFRSKEEDLFKSHAKDNHPKSSILFDKKQNDMTIKEETIDDYYEQTYIDQDLDSVEQKFSISEAENNEQIPMDQDGAPIGVDPLCEFEEYDKKLVLFPDYQMQTEEPIVKTEEIHTKKVKKVKKVKKGTFECFVCKEIFPTSKEMRDHVKEHKNEQCSQCDKAFLNPWRLKEHVKISHGDAKDRTCTECDITLSNVNNYLRHMNSVHANNEAIPEETNGKIETFECFICKKSFLKVKAMRRHVNEHRNEPCSQCGKVFENPWKLKDHIKITHADVKDRTCVLCNVIVSDINKLRAHVCKTFECYVCKETFNKRDVMRNHVKQHRNLPCGQCGKIFETASKLNYHTLTVHSEKQKCFECDIVLANKYQYKRHMNTKHPEGGQKLYECELCPYTTFVKQYLNVHKRKCPNSVDGAIKLEEKKLAQPKTWTCSKCEEIFLSWRGYMTHYESEHDGQLPPEFENAEKYYCDQCPKFYYKSWTLTAHIRKAHSENKTIYKCVECEEEFELKLYVEHYRNVHNTIPPDVKDKVLFCDKCPLFYFSKSGLDHHSKNHDAKVFQCSQCPKSFTNVQGFNEHTKKVHLKITPFECEQCPQKFGSKLHLTKHINQVHSRVTCDICNKEICNSFLLKRHKAASHGIYPPGSFKCDHCPMFFSIESSLLTHVKSKHLEVLD